MSSESAPAPMTSSAPSAVDVSTDTISQQAPPPPPPPAESTAASAPIKLESASVTVQQSCAPAAVPTTVAAAVAFPVASPAPAPLPPSLPVKRVHDHLDSGITDVFSRPDSAAYKASRSASQWNGLLRWARRTRGPQWDYGTGQ